jgi:hypothetical protein
VLDESDRRRAAAHGVDEGELERQVRLLRGPSRSVRLLRPCTPGDGLTTLTPEEHGSLLEEHDHAAAAGRCRKFVPASGAATRMFADLTACLHAGTEPASGGADAPAEVRVLRTFLDRLEEFPFRDLLRERIAAPGGGPDPLGAARPVRRLLEALLLPEGLGFAALPKGLLPFHRYPAELRTPLEEHLVEAAALVRDADGTARIHLTVSPEHEPLFRDRLEAVVPELEGRLDTRFEVTFSTQDPSTDTVALEPGGELFHTADGELLFRVSGHGALLQNLGNLDGDLVLIKNVDNVAPDPRKPPTFLWSRLLLGLLARLQDEVHAACRGLESDPRDEATLENAAALARRLHRREAPRPGESRGEHLLRLLDRPVRVCGMVPNEGEPGGGPFWVEGPEGESLQIVEGAQIDPGSGSQARIFASGTHFNPVFLACALRDHRGRPFRLERFVDPDAVIIARKTHEGRDLLALERPGLWNGAMAHWSTVFVEVPGGVFTPVKTVLDLLRPEHRLDVA